MICWYYGLLCTCTYSNNVISTLLMHVIYPQIVCICLNDACVLCCIVLIKRGRLQIPMHGSNWRGHNFTR